MSVAYVAMHLMACQIERQITNTKLEYRFFRIPSPQRSYTCQQFPHCKWLWQVIIGAELYPGNTVLYFTACGQHQHTTGKMFRTQMPEDFKAVDSGQNNIQHNQIERRCFCLIQSFFTVVGDDWIVPGLGERRCNLPR